MKLAHPAGEEGEPCGETWSSEHCPGVTITLTGRGQIVFAEVIDHEVGGPPATAPITGGTGEFLAATGTVTAKVLSSTGDFVITITK